MVNFTYFSVTVIKFHVLQALWSAETRDITEEMHEEFYRFISNSFDKPRFYLHYKADAPLNIRALFYVPEYKPSKLLAGTTEGRGPSTSILGLCCYVIRRQFLLQCIVGNLVIIIESVTASREHDDQ